jgi:hypothetical protein
MNEKLKRKTLNDAYKRFQRLPMLLPKSDTRASETEKPGWQPMPFGMMGQCIPANPNSAWQALAE